jgi:transcriptional regulator with XRE-family HTH domain
MATSDIDRFYQLVGERVLRMRLTRELSQGKLADRVGLTRVSIVNIEKGRQRTPLHVLWQIAKALDVELTTFIPGSQDFEAMASGVQLDTDTIAHIEAATRGDPSAARQLTDFIRRARARSTDGDSSPEIS